MDTDGNIPFPDSSFDYVMFNDVLHHVRDAKAFIVEASRVAGAILIFEDAPSLFLRVVDVVLNYFYSPQMPRPLNLRHSRSGSFYSES